MDALLAPLMDALLACLGAELADTPGGKPCALMLFPGQQAYADFCSCGKGGCGQAWVRLGPVFPSQDQFPSPDVKPGNCSTVLAATLELGVWRCVPTLKTGGNPPGPVEQTNAALDQVEDMWAIYRAITCCGALDERLYVLGTYQPSTAGDCGGGTWPLTVRLMPKPNRSPRD